MLKARKQKARSQEELATASGLNLRTIQRIESEGAASLQSTKALASALDLDIHDLDQEENHMRTTWEYRVIETKDRASLQTELTTAGSEGWELVSSTAMFNTLMTRIVYTRFLKRPVSYLQTGTPAAVPPGLPRASCGVAETWDERARDEPKASRGESGILIGRIRNAAHIGPESRKPRVRMALSAAAACRRLPNPAAVRRRLRAGCHPK